MFRHSPIVLPALVILALFACGGDDRGLPANPTGSEQSTAPTGTSSSTPVLSPNFLNIDRFPTSLLISGGPPKDGIPALTDPAFAGATSSGAEYLSDRDLVLGVYVNGEARAYPHNIGWHHEIINDTVGNLPIVVTFCPLTGTGLVFDATDDGSVRLELGVSGLLFNNNLVMYDRRDNETLYPQMIFTGIQGLRRGQELLLQPVVETTWGYWKTLYPGTTVVSSTSEGAYSSSRYRIYPYGPYRDLHSGVIYPIVPGPDENPMIGVYPPKEMILGIRFVDKAKGYPFPELEAAGGVVNDSVAGEDILIVYSPEERLAVPFSRLAGDLVLTFDKVATTRKVFPFMVRDRETGTTWNLLGQGISGQLEGYTLRQLPAHNAFWFAWATFWQNTEIFTAD